MPKERKSKKSANPVLDGEDSDVKSEKAPAAKPEKVAPAKERHSAPKDEAVSESGGSSRPLVEKMKMPGVPMSVPGKTNIARALSADQRNMKKFLESQPKYPIMIPLRPGEKRGSIQDVWLNGFHIQVPKGEMVNVPEEVFNVLNRGIKLRSEAGRDKLVSRDGKVEDALTS